MLDGGAPASYLGGRPQMEVRVSGSARREPLRVLVGTARVAGSMMGWHVQGDYLYVAYRWGTGYAFDIGAHKVNDQGIGDVLQAVYGGPDDFDGSPTGSVNTGWAAFFGWGTAWRWVPWTAMAWYMPGLVDLGIGIPSLSATVKLRVWDFTAGVPAWSSDPDQSLNPILQLYTYAVINPFGPRVPTAAIHSASWEAAAADWCDAIVGGEARWRSGGVCPAGSKVEAVKALLRASWCSLCWIDGQWRLNPRLTSMDPDNDAETYLATAFVRSRGNIRQQPTQVRIGYRDANEEYIEDSRLARTPGLIAGTSDLVEQTEYPALMAFADVAQRDAQFSLDSITEEGAQATATVDLTAFPAVLNEVPGNFLWIRRYVWSGGARLFRLLSMTVNSESVMVKLGLLRANATLTAEGVASSGPTTTPPVITHYPTPPDSCTQRLIEVGAWDYLNDLMGVPDPNDLTKAGFTATDIDVDVDTDPETGEVASYLTVTDATGTIDVSITPEAYLEDQFYASLCLRWDTIVEAGITVKLLYQTRPTAGAWTTRNTSTITPAGSRWGRWGKLIPVYSADEHRLRLEVTHSGAPDSEVLWMRLLRCVGCDTDPAAQPQELRQLERWTWTYASEPSDVRGYVARVGRTVVGTADFGASSLSYTTFASGLGFQTEPPGGGNSISAGGGDVITASYLALMLAAGFQGTLAVFPDPTQSFTAPDTPVRNPIVHTDGAWREVENLTDYTTHILEGEYTLTNLDGTWEDMIAVTMPANQSGDGGSIIVQVEVKDETDDEAQHVTARYRWDAARRSESIATSISETGTQGAAYTDAAGNLEVAMRFTPASINPIQISVTSTLDGGSSPVGTVRWRIEWGGRATISEAY
jgi:hypothetical protein